MLNWWFLPQGAAFGEEQRPSRAERGEHPQGKRRLAGEEPLVEMDPPLHDNGRDAAEVVPPPGPGVCLVNPPYGVRLGEAAEESWRAVAALLPRLAGWKVGVLAGSAALARLLPAPADEPLEVRNGGLRCRLLVFGPGDRPPTSKRLLLDK